MRGGAERAVTLVDKQPAATAGGSGAGIFVNGRSVPVGAGCG